MYHSYKNLPIHSRIFETLFITEESREMTLFHINKVHLPKYNSIKIIQKVPSPWILINFLSFRHIILKNEFRILKPQAVVSLSGIFEFVTFIHYSVFELKICCFC